MLREFAMTDNTTHTILVTGGTGAFGEFLVARLREHGNSKIILLVRAPNNEQARKRVEQAVGNSPNIEVIAADLEKKLLGLTKTDYTALQKHVTHVLHAAASTRFTHPLEEARERNVETTKRILEFAMGCTSLNRLGYVSTALVAGKRVGLVREDEFEHDRGFINTYEQSKYEAEAIVRDQKNDMPLVILRPPLVISKPRPEYQGPVNLLSHSLNLLKKDYLPLLPGTRDSVFDIVDGVATANATVDLLLKKHLEFDTYHLSNGSRALNAGQILDMLEEHLGRKISVKFCGDMGTFKKKLWWATLWRPWLRLVYKKTASYLPELAYPKTFDNTRLLKELNMQTFGPAPDVVFRSILE